MTHSVPSLRRPDAGAVALALLLLPAIAHAGVIRGRLLTTPAPARGAAAAVPSPGGRAPSAAALPVQRGAADAVIYILAVPEKVEKKLTKRPKWGPAEKLPRIAQEKRAFEPRVLVTTAGNQVEFANLDRVYHNAFSVSAAKRFDLGKYPPGHVDTVRFERPGVANLHCDIHPDESGFVVVVPNHVFTRPDSLGRYKLPKLPPGVYTLCAWHSRLGELRREVTMPRHGDVTLDLRF